MRGDTTVQNMSLGQREALIERCERVRAWNYSVRADGLKRAGTTGRTADAQSFGRAQVWCVGDHARVHLLDGATVDQLPGIERWLSERGVSGGIDVLPIDASPSVVSVLRGRGYRFVRSLPLLIQALDEPASRPLGPCVVVEVDVEDPEFVETYLAGYEVPAVQRAELGADDVVRWRAESARCFLARLDGRPIAAATLVVHDKIARLANCVTLPEARSRGAQAALIAARLQCSRDLGIELAIADAQLDGPSYRNLTRAGFRLGAAIAQWRKPAA